MDYRCGTRDNFFQNIAQNLNFEKGVEDSAHVILSLKKKTQLHNFFIIIKF